MTRKPMVFVYALLFASTSTTFAEEYKKCIKKSDWAIEGYFFNNVKWDPSKSSTDKSNFRGPPPETWSGKVTFQRKGVIIEAWLVKNGKVMTYEKWDDSGKNLQERWAYLNDCAHGKIRRDAGSSWIDASYENGYERGLQVRYDKDSGRIAEEWTIGPDGSRGISAEYNRLGNLSKLECEPPISASVKHRELCGLNGKPSTVKLYSTDNQGKPYVLRQLGYLNGKQHGMARTFDETGKATSSVNYKNGLKDGEQESEEVSYNDFGGSKMTYVDGKAEGKETRYFKDSKIIQTEIEWKAGDVISQIEYHQNGNKKISRIFKDGAVQVTTFNDDGKKESYSVVKHRRSWWGEEYVPDGKVLFFDKGGNKSYEATYQDGKRHGTTLFFFPKSHQISRRQVWDTGKLTMQTEYTKDGKVEKVTEYFPDGSKKVKKP